MYTRIKTWLKFAAKTFLQWLLHNIYTAILGSSILSLLALVNMEGIWHSATALLQLPLNTPPQELLLWHLLLVCLIVPFVFSLGVKFIEWRNRHSIYYFIKSGGLKWRARKDKNKVKDFPFCPEHNLQLVPIKKRGRTGSYVAYLCPTCGDKYTEGVKREELTNTYQKVKSIAEANFYDYNNA